MARPRRGFAAATLPYQPEALAFVDGQRNVVDGVDDGAVAGEESAGTDGELDAEVVDFDEDRGGGIAVIVGGHKGYASFSVCWAFWIPAYAGMTWWA